MKKLMFAAALAACTTVVSAGDISPQIYDMTITIKTSFCNKKNDVMAKINSQCNAGFDGIVYRQQYTYKLAGAFWGCDCDVIGAPSVWGTTTDAKYAGKKPYEQEGFLFWSATTKHCFYSVTGAGTAADPFMYTTWKQEFTWEALNLIGKKASNVEGKFNFVVYAEDGTTKALDLQGAGYGTAKTYGVLTCTDAKGDKVDATMLNYIKSMKGYVVGTFDLVQFAGASVGCPYCGDELPCDAFQFCACDNCAAKSKVAPAFGTWTLKYNSSAVSKTNGNKLIYEADSKIPSTVRQEMLFLPAVVK